MIMQQNWKRNTSVFLGGQLISLFGSSLVQFAITWHITLTTQSGSYLTLAIICGFVPTFFLSPFAGVWADRYDRKKLVMLADGAIAVTTLILALSILWGYRALWPLFVALGIRALGTAVQMPCIGAILPSIVPPEHLTRVNGINSSAQSIITLASPMLSALLLKTAPYFFIFLIDVATAAIAIAIMFWFFQLPKRTSTLAGQPHDYLGELKQGVSYVLRTPYLRLFFLFLSISFFLFAPSIFLTPLQVTRNYGEDALYLMSIEVAFSVGMLLGGVLITLWGGFRNRIYSIALSLALVGLCTVVLGFPLSTWLDSTASQSPAALWLSTIIPKFPFSLWVYLLTMGLIGLVIPVYNTPAMVLLQEQVDPDYMGRVFGVMTMITSSVMPIGMLAFGPIADVVPVEWLLLSTGAIIVLLSVFIVRSKPLLEAGLPKSLEVTEAEVGPAPSPSDPNSDA
jgi:DHA3 family macrolide efflux protein-like MFS transporter